REAREERGARAAELLLDGAVLLEGGVAALLERLERLLGGRLVLFFFRLLRRADTRVLRLDGLRQEDRGVRLPLVVVPEVPRRPEEARGDEAADDLDRLLVLLRPLAELRGALDQRIRVRGDRDAALRLRALADLLEPLRRGDLEAALLLLALAAAL